MPLAESNNPSRTRYGITRIGLLVSADHVVGGMASVRFLLPVLLPAVLLGGCSGEAGKEKMLIEEAQAAVNAEMIDPTSTLFTDVTEDGSASVCGYVNGKNRLGAYAGRKRFVWVDGGTAVIEMDPGTAAGTRAATQNACAFEASFVECKGGTPERTVIQCFGASSE